MAMTHQQTGYKTQTSLSTDARPDYDPQMPSHGDSLTARSAYKSRLPGSDLSLDAQRDDNWASTGGSVDGLITGAGTNTRTHHQESPMQSKTQFSPDQTKSGDFRSIPILENMKSPEGHFLSGPCSLPSRSSMIESFECLDAEISVYRDQMPPDLKVGYIDVLILYHEDNRRQAIEFRDHLRKDINLPNGEKVRALLYDEPELEALHTLKIGHLATTVERSTYVFMFLTKEFTSDKWMEFSSESCLMEAITNPEKMWCVVPVFTERRGKSFRIPMGLNTLKGISYYNNDKFYRAGLERLIGDKVQNRKAGDEKLKVRQKQWIEKYKREKAIQRENERRTALIEEQKTQQLVDKLVYETGRMYRDGALPAPETYDHHGPTYIPSSRTSSYVGNMPHSLSSGSLNPLKQQHPAVQSHFQQLNQQMRPWDNVISEQQYLRRSTSTPSTCDGDMGAPSVVAIQLHTQYGTQAVEIPISLAEELKRLPAKEREVRLNEYFRQTQEQTCHKSVSGPYHPANVKVPSQIWERIKNLPEDVREKSIQYYCEELNRKTNSGDVMIENNSLTSQDMPQISGVLHSFGHSSYGSHWNGNAGNAQGDVSLNSSLQHPSAEQYIQGGIPHFSRIEEDGLPSARTSIPTDVRSIIGERSSNMNQEGRSMSDKSCVGTEGLSMGEPTFMKKPAMTIQSEKSTIEPESNQEKHVHYTINIYGTANLQVGDHNKMEKRRDSTHSDDDQSDDNDEDEDEGGTSVKVSSAKSKKKRPSQDSAPGEEQQLKPCKDSEYNDEEATRSKLGYGDEDGSHKSTERLVSGEVRPSQGPSSASGTSCNVDAAPSTQYTPPMKLGADTGAKVAANNFPYVVAEHDSNEQSEEPATLQVKSSKTKEGSFLEESVNMQSQRSWLTKSSEGQKNIVSVPPVVKPNVVQKHNSPEKHGTVEKPIAAVRPQAVVKPMELGDEPDNDNEELTDPKSLVRSVNTSAKALGNAVVSGGISQSTVVKQVDAAPPQTRTFSVNQSQNNKQNTNQVSVRDSLAQTNAKVVSMYDSHEETNVKVAQFGFTRFGQQQQFCTNISPSNDRVRGNMDSIDGQEVEEAQEASLTNQKRSGKSASNATSPQQQTGAVRNSGVSVDQEYDLLETDSFEEDHFGPVTGSSSSNKSAKKECVIS